MRWSLSQFLPGLSFRPRDLPRSLSKAVLCDLPFPLLFTLYLRTRSGARTTTHGRDLHQGGCMNVSQRGQEDLGVSVLDGIRVGSIAVATYEYVAPMTRQLLVM